MTLIKCVESLKFLTVDNRSTVPPLTKYEVFKDSETSRIRNRFRKELIPLHKKRSDLAQGMDLLLNVFAIFAAADVGAKSSEWPLVLGIICKIAVVFFIGTRMRALGNIVHECSHSTFFKKKSWNSWLGTCLCVMDFASFEEYRRDHITHHLYLGDRSRDRDFAARSQFLTENDLTQAMILRHVRTLFSPAFYLSYLNVKAFSLKEAPGLMAMRLIWLVILATVAFTFDSKNFCLCYLLPYVTTYQWLRYFSDVVDHAGIIHKGEGIHGNELTRSRNHIFSVPFLNWLIFPRNDMLHAVHHLFPSLPTDQLQAAHLILLHDPVYAAKEHAISAIGNT